VDNSSALWLGLVVPKRHARRSVTRSLVKRQLRAAFERHAAALDPGQWLLRLRAPLATSVYRSASSERLAADLREELDALLQRCAAAAAPATRSAQEPQRPGAQR
jgi:ribonuclease P protein component